MEAIVRKATRGDERELFALAGAFPTPTPPEFSTFRHAFESMLADLSAALFVAEIVSDQRGCKPVGLATSGASAFYERLGYVSKAGYDKKYLSAST